MAGGNMLVYIFGEQAVIPPGFFQRTALRLLDHYLQAKQKATGKNRWLDIGAPSRNRTCAPGSGGRCSHPLSYRRLALSVPCYYTKWPEAFQYQILK
jgi:hypothetical protein